ncbi:SDR family NAD(P)-dependent oxidoreductase [Roseomonas sp. M0104]|uniref:SDR family NAD(P)-dependent oxidoreductase n=1 Tax=Teichococcus coralli TaxID=2545983 RepID=A0A845BC68_9PROT|nr:SDR family NAD(P)-dependent oxidoreductase [Pseudoroseomonas coralli]
MSKSLVVLGLGYAGHAAARAALAAGFAVAATRRAPRPGEAPAGITLLPFAEAGPAIAAATHLLVTAGPEAEGDPVLATHRQALQAAARLCWVGYISTTGIYGDHGGAWVDEATPPTPQQERTRRRLRAEQAWAAALAGTGAALDIFRAAGIYGPGRSMFDDLRAGSGRRVDKPDHLFSRIHRDDIAAAVVAAALNPPAPGGPPRVLHLADDEPASGAAVTEEAARLLGVPPPPLVPFAEAFAAMSPMGRSFWAENRRVASAKTKAALGLAWRHPTYREGLRAILAEEACQGGADPA